jgi:hypothetical protein
MNRCRSDKFRQGDQVPITAMNSAPQFAAEGVFLSRLSHAPLPEDKIGQFCGDVFPGLLKASQVVGR